MNRNGELKMIGVIADTLGIRGLQEMGYNITKTNLKPRFVLDLLEKQAKRQEFIDLLKGRLKNQITSFTENIAKVLDKDTSLAEKIRTLFREQGIMIASILTTIRMAIGVLVEALLPVGGAATGSGGEPPPKDRKGLNGWIRNKLKELASLLGRLGIKAAEALPGIIGGII